jgi:DNA-binding NarL/FixJ family response regulator
LADDHGVVRKGVRTNLMKKLTLHNTAEIVLYAIRRKIIC